MKNEQKQRFTILTETLELILYSYNNNKFIPNWLFKFWHVRDKQVAEFIQHLRDSSDAITDTTSYGAKYNELLMQLDDWFYLLSVRSVSHRLRYLIQDALIAALNFSADDINVYEDLYLRQGKVQAYIDHFKKTETVTEYFDYFSKRHSLYGLDASNLGQDEILHYAKAALINGMLLDHFGLKAMIKKNMSRVKDELQIIITKNIEKGFLDRAKAESYCEKIDLVIAACDNPDPDVDESARIQNARYVLENITSAAGVLPLGPAKYPEHAVLLTSCYWADEVLLQARGKDEVA